MATKPYNCETLYKLIKEYKKPLYNPDPVKKDAQRQAMIAEMNCDKLNALFSVERRCTARTFDREDRYKDPWNFASALVAVYEKFADIPKNRRVGCTVRYCPADATAFPSAYKYIPDGTFLFFEWRKSGLFLVDVTRDTCNMSRAYNCEIKLTDTAREALLTNWTHNL